MMIPLFNGFFFLVCSPLVPNSGTVTIALIGAGAAIIGSLLSGAYQHWRDWHTRPILQIDYEETPANKVETSQKKSDGTEAGNVYIRVRVRNTGRRTAKGSLVFLTSLKEVHPSGTTATAFFDSMPVAWPGWNFVPRDIPPAPDVHFYVDVVRVSKEQRGWEFCVESMFTSHAALKNYSGTYRFRLMVTADNAEPSACEIDVTYDGDWHSIRALPASKR
jgi:hypothetical protein